MALSLIDHVELGISRLISQYKDQPRIEALLTSYLNRIQNIEEAILDVYSGVINLDEAVGDNLDIVGSILDEPRAGQPDYIYRRRLQAKVYVIRSQGTVQDLLTIIRKFEGLYQSDGETPDSSDIYVVLSEAWDGTNQTGETKGTEITILPEATNEWEDPNPFDPKGMHDNLLKARGAGEPLQSIYGIVNISKSPKEHSLRLIHSQSGGMPPTSSTGFGSLYVTGSSTLGLSLFGGPLGHRRSGISNFVDNGGPAIQNAPFLETVTNSPTRLQLTPGIWSNFPGPQDREYTLYRSSSAGGIVADSTLVTTSLENINSYVLQTSDAGYSMFVREKVYFQGNNRTADSNLIFNSLSIMDSALGINLRFNPDDGVIETWTGADGLRIKYVWDTENWQTNNGLFVLTSSFYNNSPNYIAPGVGNNTLGVGAAGFAGPAASHQRFMGWNNTVFSSPNVNFSRPTTILALFMPTGTLGSNKYTALAMNNDPFSAHWGYMAATGSKWGVQDFYNPAPPPYYTNMSGGTVTTNSPVALLYYSADDFASSSQTTSASLWVNDFRTASRITGSDRSGTFSPDFLVVGWDNVNINTSFQGYIWEIAVLTGSLSQTQRTIWANYLNNRYGLSIQKD